MRRALVLVLLLAGVPAQASHTANDCGLGVDAPGEPQVGLAVALPLACEGALEPREGDTWDVFAVTFSEGPVYARLAHASAHAFCIVDGAWTDSACDEHELELWWPAGPAFLVVLADGAGGGYALEVAQQDDCGTGVDALWEPAAPVATTYVHCEALLDVFTGDAEDAFLVPPPAVPDVVLVRMEPTVPQLRICVDDEIRQAGLRSRCTDSTFSRIVVARDTIRTMRVTVEGFSVQPVGYTLVVENAAEHPPRIPPLLT